MSHDEWFIGKVTIEGEEKEYPFTVNGITQSQSDWNGVIERTIHGFQQVNVYKLETPPEALDSAAVIAQLRKEVDFSVVRQTGLHVDGSIAVITDDVENTTRALNFHAPQWEKDDVRIYSSLDYGACDECEIVFPKKELSSVKGRLTCSAH